VNKVITGLENLLQNPQSYLRGSRIGLVINHTSIDSQGRLSTQHFQSAPKIELKKLFAPEHGLYGIDQDMIHVKDSRDPITGLKVISLYGEQETSLIPPAELLQGLDSLIFDIQDVGSRYYTFIYTMANCMQVCKEAGVQMVVCDRPNPINGVDLEGNLVGEKWCSFVGQYPIPNRHAMTVGELALLFNETFELGCDLKIVPMKGWQREMWFDDTGLPWTPPSPNMPTLATATVYPGMCLIEGTLLSEGRGTTMPFEFVGAPYIHPPDLINRLQKDQLPGVFFRPHYFKPMFQKWAGEVCGGVQLHITDRNQFRSLITAIAIIRAVKQLYGDDFSWRTEPYEYVSDRLAIDLLYGNAQFREEWMGSQVSLQSIEGSWSDDLKGFIKLRQDFLIY
jgi:uncharacterized protein YbbC (DUF1343 family)